MKCRNFIPPFVNIIDGDDNPSTENDSNDKENSDGGAYINHCCQIHSIILAFEHLLTQHIY